MKKVSSGTSILIFLSHTPNPVASQVGAWNLCMGHLGMLEVSGDGQSRRSFTFDGLQIGVRVNASLEEDCLLFLIAWSHNSPLP